MKTRKRAPYSGFGKFTRPTGTAHARDTGMHVDLRTPRGRIEAEKVGETFASSEILFARGYTLTLAQTRIRLRLADSARYCIYEDIRSSSFSPLRG